MALPVPLHGSHHLLGNIGVCPDLVLCPCVVLPPAPRYVKGGRCADNTHSTNTGNPNYKGDILEQTAHIRKVLRDEMVGSKLLGVWVSDVIFGLAGGSHGQDSESTARNISDLYVHCRQCAPVHSWIQKTRCLYY